MLGFLLTMDVIHRGAAWMDMYSSVGVLPTPLNLQRPQAWGAFTIFNAFCTPGELRVLWVVLVGAGTVAAHVAYNRPNRCGSAQNSQLKPWLSASRSVHAAIWWAPGVFSES